jgi:hypothetical protein
MRFIQILHGHIAKRPGLDFSSNKIKEGQSGAVEIHN